MTTMTDVEYKVIRRVRTPAGQAKYGQPIGTIIVRDGSTPLQHLTLGDKSPYAGWERVNGSDKRQYDVGFDEDSKVWVATGVKGGWDDIAVDKAHSEEEVLELLDKQIAAGRKPRGVTAMGGMSYWDDSKEKNQFEKEMKKTVDAARVAHGDKRKKTYDKYVVDHIAAFDEAYKNDDEDGMDNALEKLKQRTAVVNKNASLSDRAKELANRKAPAAPKTPPDLLATERTLRGLEDGDLVDVMKSGVVVRGRVTKVGKTFHLQTATGSSELGGVNSKHKWRVAAQNDPGMERHNREMRYELAKRKRSHAKRLIALSESEKTNTQIKDSLNRYRTQRANINPDADPSAQVTAMRNLEVHLDSAEAAKVYADRIPKSGLAEKKGPMMHIAGHEVELVQSQGIHPFAPTHIIFKKDGDTFEVDVPAVKPKQKGRAHIRNVTQKTDVTVSMPSQSDYPDKNVLRKQWRDRVMAQVKESLDNHNVPTTGTAHASDVKPSIPNKFAVKDRVETEWGLGNISAVTPRSVTIKLDDGNEINIQQGTPGLGRVKKSKASKDYSKALESPVAVAYRVQLSTIGKNEFDALIRQGMSPQDAFKIASKGNKA